MKPANSALRHRSTGVPSPVAETSCLFVLARRTFLAVAILALSHIARAQGQNVEFVGQIGGECSVVCVAGNYAYINEGAALRILDVSNTSSPVSCARILLPANIYGLCVSGSTAYVAGGAKGLLMVDVSSTSQPRLVGSYDTSGTAWGVYVSGSLAYVADGNSGLQIIDVSDPSQPHLLGSIVIASYETVRGVYVSGTLAYVVSSLRGLWIVDVNNPSHPRLLGSYSVSSASGVHVSGSLAYVAASPGGLRIIDVSDPTQPRLRGSYVTSHLYKAVYVSGTVAYIADGHDGLQLMDVSNSSQPQPLALYRTPGYPKGIFVSATLVYVADGQLQIIDVSDPSQPRRRGSYDEPFFSAARVRVSGQTAYVAEQYYLHVLDVSNPSQPQTYGDCFTSGGANGLHVSGNLVYVAGHRAGLIIIDVSDPRHPQLRSSYSLPGYARGVWVSDGMAYVANFSDALQMVDVSDPTSPTLRASCPLPGNAEGVSGSGSLVYVTWNTFDVELHGGLAIIDVSSPSQPLLRGSYDGLIWPCSVHVLGSLAYVTDRRSGLQIIDVSDPTRPTLRGSYAGAVGNEAYVSGGFAYTGPALQVIDVGDPSSPTLRGSFDRPISGYGVHVSNGLCYLACLNSGLWILRYTGPPATPSNLVATPVPGNRINLSWNDNSDSEDGFKIERRTAPAGSWSQIATTGRDVTSYQNAGLVSNLYYQYRVRAYNSAGDSNPALSALVATADAPPMAPSLLTAMSDFDSEVKLVWQDNSNNEMGFQIERKGGWTSAWVQITTVTANVTTYRDRGLSSGTTYVYRVRAYNPLGRSAYSNEAIARAGTRPPAAPSNLTAVPLAWSYVLLSWRDNSRDEYGFKIERRVGSTTMWIQIATVGANVRTYLDARVLPKTLYSYRIRAYNVHGDSFYSNVASVQMPENRLAARPAWSLYK